MAKWVLQDIIDEGGVNPDALQQIIGALKGYDAFGAAITPTVDDDVKTHSFENKGIGGVLKLLGKGGIQVFLAGSDATTPAPTLTAGNPTVKLWGPNGQPLLTTESTETVKNKTFPSGGGNAIDGSQITTGTISADRVAVGGGAIIKRNAYQQMPNGSNLASWDTLVYQTSGAGYWAAGNPTRITLAKAGMWLIVIDWSFDIVQQIKGQAGVSLKFNGTTFTNGLNWQGTYDTGSGTENPLRGTESYAYYTAVTTDYVEAYFDVDNNNGTNEHRLEADSRMAAFFMGP